MVTINDNLWISTNTKDPLSNESLSIDPENMRIRHIYQFATDVYYSLPEGIQAGYPRNFSTLSQTAVQDEIMDDDVVEVSFEKQVSDLADEICAEELLADVEIGGWRKEERRNFIEFKAEELEISQIETNFAGQKTKEQVNKLSELTDNVIQLYMKMFELKRINGDSAWEDVEVNFLMFFGMFNARSKTIACFMPHRTEAAIRAKRIAERLTVSRRPRLPGVFQTTWKINFSNGFDS